MPQDQSPFSADDFCHVGPETIEHVRASMGAWLEAGGDAGEIATAMMLQGYAAHLILGGRADILALYDRAALAADAAAPKEGLS